MSNLRTQVPTVWGAAPLELDNVRGVLQLPIPTLEALCRELRCQPGDVLKYED